MSPNHVSSCVCKCWGNRNESKVLWNGEHNYQFFVFFFLLITDFWTFTICGFPPVISFILHNIPTRSVLLSNPFHKMRKQRLKEVKSVTQGCSALKQQGLRLVLRAGWPMPEKYICFQPSCCSLSSYKPSHLSFFFFFFFFLLQNSPHLSSFRSGFRKPLGPPVGPLFWASSALSQNSPMVLIIPTLHSLVSELFKKHIPGLPWWSSGYDSARPMQGAWVQSLVRKLLSLTKILCAARQKKKKASWINRTYKKNS